ncbi:hypothetical protein ACGFZP_39105 [Kitasatospora sp. NPDC048239]|uniref:hypothetical protein n=1 Tax=Kitasatospora sp. NPDC048239 TaxID=3364046 RepID=UPI003719D4E8
MDAPVYFATVGLRTDLGSLATPASGSTLPANLLYQDNTYLGFGAPPSDPQASTADAGFVGPPATPGYGLGSLSGYRLLTGSPALRSGTPVIGDFGKDLWGNTANTATPNHGAYAGTGHSPLPARGPTTRAGARLAGGLLHGP